MGMTKIILSAYAVLVLFCAAESWHVGRMDAVVTDLPLAVVVLAALSILERNLAKSYRAIAVAAGALAALSLVRLVRTHLVIPHAAMAALGAMIFLLCAIKWLQLRRN